MLQLLDFDSRLWSFGNGSGEAAFETRVRGSDIVLEPDATGVVVHTLGRVARWVFGRLCVKARIWCLNNERLFWSIQALGGPRKAGIERVGDPNRGTG